MEHIKKRLIFYFYAFEGFTDNRAIKIHLRCLKHYAHVFDEALFVISVDDTENEQLIYIAETELLKLGFKDIHFKVRKNNGYREAQAFYDEIVKKLNALDGLTFFGHTKGTTNYGNGWAVEESLDAWLIGTYYLNLEFIDEVEECAVKLYGSRFYGAFLSNYIVGNKNKMTYYGSFYWINCPVIWADAKKDAIELPCDIGNRAFVEDFPALLYDWKEGAMLTTHLFRYLHPYKPYEETHKIIHFLLAESTEGYDKFKEEVLCGI